MSRLIPTVAIAVPYYLIVQAFGLINTYWALIAIYSVLTLPFTTLVLTLYFRGLPDEIDEAAQVEGASPWRILRDITLPLALPSIIGAGLFAFMLAYSEFLFALFITTTRERRTLPVILGAALGQHRRLLEHADGQHRGRRHPDAAAGLPGLALHGARPDQRGGAGIDGGRHGVGVGVEYSLRSWSQGDRVSSCPSPDTRIVD